MPGVVSRFEQYINIWPVNQVSQFSAWFPIHVCTSLPDDILKLLCMVHILINDRQLMGQVVSLVLGCINEE